MDFKNTSFTKTDSNYLEEQYSVQKDISKKLNILSRKDLFFKNDINEIIISYDFTYSGSFVDSDKMSSIHNKGLGGKQEILYFLKY